MSATVRRPELANAACRTPEGVVMFLAEGSSTILDCKAICAGCPERLPCLAWALEQETTWGVWGGHTVAELNGMRAGLPVPTLPVESATTSAARTRGRSSRAVQTAPPTPPRRRIVRLAQLPGAHTPPVPRLVFREPVSPADIRPTAATPAVPAPQPPDDGPGSPAWIALATSPAVRKWAVAKGWQVPAPGVSLPGAIVLAYRAAHPGGAT